MEDTAHYTKISVLNSPSCFSGTVTKFVLWNRLNRERVQVGQIVEVHYRTVGFIKRLKGIKIIADCYESYNKNCLNCGVFEAVGLQEDRAKCAACVNYNGPKTLINYKKMLIVWCNPDNQERYNHSVRIGIIAPDAESKIYFGSIYSNNPKYQLLKTLGRDAEQMHINVYAEYTDIRSVDDANPGDANQVVYENDVVNIKLIDFELLAREKEEAVGIIYHVADERAGPAGDYQDVE